MYILTVSQGPDRGKQLRILDGRPLVIGSGEDADLVLTDPKVLHPHCTLQLKGDRILLENKTASAGTFVGDKKVDRGLIAANNQFRVGDTVLKLRLAPKQAPDPTDDPLIGKIIGGYALKEVVGKGGMGTVYRATQLSLHRDVALKVLAPKLAADKSFRDLFINEARAAGQLIHPNIVQVYDTGREGEYSYFSMEFIGQGSIEEVLQQETKLPWEEAILQVLEAAHGLEYAEKKHIVHRDIKPDNLMINDDGRVKIADLGLAKRGEGGADEGIIGTPHFIPPEQALGKEVDQRADIYSLGATFFRMLTGTTVFSGKTAKEIVLKHIKEPPPLASSREKSIPSELDAVLARCLAKDPGKRYQSPTDLVHALEKICAEHGIKGAVIKRGVPKRVLIPVIILAIGAIVFGGYALSKDPEIVKDKEAEAKNIKLREQRKRDQERLAAAAREGKKKDAQNALLAIKGDQSDLHPIGAVFNDEETSGKYEREWKRMAADFEDYAETHDEDYPDLAQKARERAKWIDDKLQTGRDTIGAKLAEVKAISKKIDAIDAAGETQHLKFIQNIEFGLAYNHAIDMAVLDPDDKPRPDPFQEIVDWKWVNPTDKRDEQTIQDFPKVKAKFEQARRYWKKKAQAVISAANAHWKKIDNFTKDLVVTADNETEVLEAIKVLDDAERAFQAEGVAPDHEELAGFAVSARNRAKALNDELKKRRAELLLSDRNLIRDRLRLIRTLHGATFNHVMNLNFGDDNSGALAEYGKLARQLQTGRYKGYIKERREFLLWMRYLCQEWQRGIQASLKNRAGGPFRHVKMSLPADPQNGRKMLSGTLVKFKGSIRNADQFRFKRTAKSPTDQRLGNFGMDWVYQDAFMHEGEPRWKAPTPAIEFALGAFCFETFQFMASTRHFEKLVADKTYGPAAKFMLERAKKEAQALAEYITYCEYLSTVAKEPKRIPAMQARLKAFENRFAGTGFLLDVLPLRLPVRDDFFPADPVAIPKAPEPAKLPD
ncbi:MAG: FHA domain-containing serine/threonine-protein kinase [Planctomycetota bacterium]